MNKFILNDLKAESVTLIHSDKLDKVFSDFAMEDKYDFDLKSYKEFISSSIRSYGVTEFVQVMRNFIEHGINVNVITIEDCGKVGELLQSIDEDGIVLLNVIEDGGESVLFYRKEDYSCRPIDFDEFELSIYDNQMMKIDYNNREFYCLTVLLNSFISDKDRVLVFSDSIIDYSNLLESSVMNESVEVVSKFHSGDLIKAINEYRVFDTELDHKTMAYSIENIFKATPAIKYFSNKYEIDYNNALRDKITWVDLLISRGPINFFKHLYTLYKKYGRNIEIHPGFLNLMESHNGKELVVNFFLDRNEIIAFRGVFNNGGDIKKALEDAYNRYGLDIKDGKIEYNGYTITQPNNYLEKLENSGIFTLSSLPEKREIEIVDNDDEVVIGDDPEFERNFKKNINDIRKNKKDDSKPLNSLFKDTSTEEQPKEEETQVRKKRPRINNLSQYKVTRDNNGNIIGKSRSKNFPRKNESYGDLFENIYIQDIVYNILNDEKYSDLTLEELVESFDENEIKLFKIMKESNSGANPSIEKVKKAISYLRGVDVSDITKIHDEANNWAYQLKGKDGWTTISYDEVNDCLDKHEETLTESETYDESYTHFVINKSDNTIVDAYDYGDAEKEDIIEWVKQDLKDRFDGELKFKDVKIVTRAAAIKQNIGLTYDNAFKMNENAAFTLKAEDLTSAVESYINCALWVEELDDADITVDETEVKRVSEDIKKFYDIVSNEFGTELANHIFSLSGTDVSSSVGHELYLSRNGHGSGFFDADEFDSIKDGLSDRLQDLAREMGTDDYFTLLKLEDEEESTLESKILKSELGRKVLTEMIKDKDVSDSMLEAALNKMDSTKVEKLYEAISKQEKLNKK